MGQFPVIDSGEHKPVSAPEGLRIALLWTGHMRSYQQLYEHHKHWLFEPMRADLFIHTWTTDESTTPTWWRRQHGPIAHTREEHLHELYDPYNLRQLKIDDASKYNFFDAAFKEANSKSTVKYEHVVSMWFTWLEAWRMMEAYEQAHGFQYDLVFKARPDISVETAMAYDTKELVLGGWFRRMNHMRHPEPTWESCCDLAAYGPRELMRIYTSLYDHRMKYAPALMACHATKTTKQQIIPEGILGRYLLDQQVPVVSRKMVRKIHRMNGTAATPPGNGK